MVNTLSGLLGPMIGGVLFGSFGIQPILWMSIGCFFLSAVMELFIHIPHQPQQAPGGVLATVRQDLGDGWRFIRREKPVFLSVMLVLALFNLVLSAALIVGIPVAVVQVLGLSDFHLGVTEAAMGLGGLAGGILAACFGPRLRLRRGNLLLLAAALTVAGMAAALLPGTAPAAGYWVVTAMSFAIMILSTMLMVQLSAAAQGQTPANLLGKVMAFIMAVSNCASPLGQAVYGVLFEKCPSWTVLLGAACAAAVTAVYSRTVFRALDPSPSRQ